MAQMHGVTVGHAFNGIPAAPRLTELELALCVPGAAKALQARPPRRPSGIMPSHLLQQCHADVPTSTPGIDR